MVFVEKEKHNKFIDLIKGFAIFLMIWGHCIQYFLREYDGFNVYDNGVFKFITPVVAILLTAVISLLVKFLDKIKLGKILFGR